MTYCDMLSEHNVCDKKGVNYDLKHKMKHLVVLNNKNSCIFLFFQKHKWQMSNKSLRNKTNKEHLLPPTGHAKELHSGKE